MRVPRAAAVIAFCSVLVLAGCAGTTETGSESGGMTYAGAGGSAPVRGGGARALEERDRTAFHRLLHDLNLTEQQEPPVRAALDSEQLARRELTVEAMSGMTQGAGPPAGMMERMQELQRQTEEKLRVLLTREQMEVYGQYVENQRKEMEAMSERGRPGGGRPGARGGSGKGSGF